jgi:hypothetical protein
MLNIKDKELVSISDIVEVLNIVVKNPAKYHIQHIDTNAGTTLMQDSNNPHRYNKISLNIVYIDNDLIKES